MSYEEIYELKYKESYQKIHDLEAQLKQLKDFAKKYDEMMNENNEAYESLEQEKENRINEQNKYNEEYQSNLENTDVNIENRNNIINKQEEQLNGLNERMKQSSEMVKNLKKEQELCVKEIRNHQKEIQKILHKIDDYMGKYEYCLTHHNELEIKGQIQRLKELEDEYQEHSKRNDELVNEIDDLTNNDPEIVKLRNEMNEINSLLKAKEIENASLRSHLNQTRDKLKQKELEQHSLEAEVDEKDDRIKSISSRISDLKSNIKELEKLRETKNTELAGELEKLDSANKQLTDIQEVVEPLSYSMLSVGDDLDSKLPELRKRVNFAIQIIISLRVQFAEIRRYDKMPREAPLKVLMCGLYLTDHLTTEEFSSEVTEIEQWNYIKNFYNYSLNFKIEDHMTDYDEPIIENIRTTLSTIDIEDVSQYSKCVGALYKWMDRSIELYDAQTEQNEKDGIERGTRQRPANYEKHNEMSPLLHLKDEDD